LHVNAVDPEVNIVLGREITFSPARMFVSLDLFQTSAPCWNGTKR
jgi:hypothetical protein